MKIFTQWVFFWVLWGGRQKNKDTGGEIPWHCRSAEDLLPTGTFSFRLFLCLMSDTSVWWSLDKSGMGNIKILYCIEIWDYIGYCFIVIRNKCLCLILKAAFKVKSCKFLNLSDSSTCSYTCLYPLSHCIEIANNYWLKYHRGNFVKNIVMFNSISQFFSIFSEILKYQEIYHGWIYSLKILQYSFHS